MVFISAFYIVTGLFDWLWCVFMVFNVILLLFVNHSKDFFVIYRLPDDWYYPWNHGRTYDLSLDFFQQLYINIYMLSCGCKTACACIQNWQCKNAGLKWIIICSGCSGRTCNNDGVVWAQPFPVLHARNVSDLLDFNSFSEPHINIQSITPLSRGGGHHHNTETLLGIYVKLLWSWQSSHGRGLKR